MGILKDINVRDLELDLISSNDEDFVTVDGGTSTPLWWTLLTSGGLSGNGSEVSCVHPQCD